MTTKYWFRTAGLGRFRHFDASHRMPALHASGDGLLQRNRFLRLVHARPRLFIATCIAIAVGVFLPADLASRGVTRWLIAWNAGAGLYVLLAAISHVHARTGQSEEDGHQPQRRCVKDVVSPSNGGGS